MASRAIKEFCKETCCCGDQTAWLECPCDGKQCSVACQLHPFRKGRNPNISAETREKRREAAKLREPFKSPNSDNKTDTATDSVS